MSAIAFAIFQEQLSNSHLVSCIPFYFVSWKVYIMILPGTYYGLD